MELVYHDSVEAFTKLAITAIKKIPRGNVATYGQLAAMAGNPRGARQVVRILNVYSESHKLPWHRVVNREGRIALPVGRGYELQKQLLEDEGVVFDRQGRIDLTRLQWLPRRR